jgi:hypothetical protein
MKQEKLENLNALPQSLVASYQPPSLFYPLLVSLTLINRNSHLHT